MQLTRRSAIAVFGASVLTWPVSAQTRQSMRVHKDPKCGCCAGWVKHVRTAGFTVEVDNSDDVAAVKARIGIPEDLASCHTAKIDGYLLEGHVPAAEIARLLRERPAALGLAVPGMPVGSPGMEEPGSEPDTYPVVLFGPGRSVLAQYRGAERV